MPIKEPAIVNIPLANTPGLGTNCVDGTTEAVELSKYCLPTLVQNTSLLEQIYYRHVQFDDVFDDVYAVSLRTPFYVYRTRLLHRTQSRFDWIYVY